MSKPAAEKKFKTTLVLTVEVDPTEYDVLSEQIEEFFTDQASWMKKTCPPGGKCDFTVTTTTDTN